MIIQEAEKRYAQLEEETKSIFPRLAVFPASFDREAMYAVCDESEPGPFGELLDAELLAFDEETYRYYLPEGARELAERLLSGAERAAAEWRLSDWGYWMMREAMDLWEEGDESSRENATALLKEEWANIQTGQAWAAAHFAEDADIARLCASYPIMELLRAHVDPETQVAWLEPAVAAARQLGDREAEAIHIGHLGIAYALLGEYHRSIECFDQQAAISRERGYARGEGLALWNKSISLYQLGELSQAIETAEAALAILERFEDEETDTWQQILQAWREEATSNK